MEFGRVHRTRRGDGIVPMINIVFLLLIFFLMTATLPPPEPFPVTPPDVREADGSTGVAVLHVGADGALALGEARGEAVFAMIGQVEEPLRLRADAGLPAADLVRLVARLRSAGAEDIELVAVAR